MSVSVRDYVHRALREAILSLELPPGTRLRIDELAQLYDVSHTPVRQALLRLESEGLVTTPPRRGAHVSALTYDEFEEMQCIRLGVEPVLARAAVTRCTPDGLSELERAFANVQAAFEAGGLDRYLHFQATFRDMFYEFADRPRLLRVAREQRLRVERYLRYLCSDTSALKESRIHQQQLLEAARDRDPEAAAAATTDALQWALTELGKLLEDKQPQ